MPYYNSQDTLRAAVTSLLKQSYNDYLLLIINDGDEPTPKDILKLSNSKLRFFDLKENKGRYFCDAVALTASPYELYLPSDSDDISSFDRLYYLAHKQKRTDADMVYHYQKVVKRTGKVIKETYPLMQQPLDNRMRHTAHWSALYKTEALREVGGIHPNFRVGYDTLIVNLIKMKFKTVCMPRFLYTRQYRTTSLTADLMTGFGSPHRMAATRRLMDLYAKCYKHPDKIKQIIHDSINPDTAKEVKKEAKRLKAEMGW